MPAAARRLPPSRLSRKRRLQRLLPATQALRRLERSAGSRGGAVPPRLRRPAREGAKAPRRGLERPALAQRERFRWLVPCALALMACSKGGGANERPASSAEATEAARTPAAAGAPASSNAGHGGAAVDMAAVPHGPGVAPVLRNGIPWYDDAAEAAFAAARASGKRVVVDLWAPWCHTCLSMQNVVMTAANLPALVDRFVWLAIDTEREANAALLERLPVAVWPTFYVVDAGPADAPAVEIRGRWLGAASAEQFSRFLADSDQPVA